MLLLNEVKVAQLLFLLFLIKVFLSNMVVPYKKWHPVIKQDQASLIMAEQIYGIWDVLMNNVQYYLCVACSPFSHGSPL